MVQRRHYELAREGHERYAAARSHWDHPSLKYLLIDGDFELAPGVSLLENSGRVPGRQSFSCSCHELVRCCSRIHAVVMKPLFTTDRKAWPTDDNEEELRASTRKLLDVVQREKAPLTVFGHNGAHWKTLTNAPHYYD